MSEDLKKRANKIDERLKRAGTFNGKGTHKAAEPAKDWPDDDKRKRRKLGGRTGADGFFISDGLGQAHGKPTYNVLDAPSPDWIFKD
jgi:hypothetical protein